MTEIDGIARRDLEQLSAFLDGELSPAETEKLEARLATDKQLSGALEALRVTAKTLRSLPEVRPPRSFALTSEMLPRRRAYPILQLTTAVAALSFVLVVGADLLISGVRSSGQAVQEPAFFAADQIAEPELGEPAAAPAEEPAAGLAEAPAEAPALEEPMVEEAESELAAAAEPEAEAAEDADDGSAEGLTSAGESAGGEEQAEDEVAGRNLYADEGTAYRVAPVEEQVPVEEALKAPPETSLDTVGTTTEDAPSLTVLRTVEIGLGVVLIALIGLTLWVRQRG
ncbi:MAG: anti-sigma factor family protein [Anaerolineales bacterium]